MSGRGVGRRLIVCLTVILAPACSSFAASGREEPEPARELDEVSGQARQAYLRRAQVWRSVNTGALDLAAGPGGPQSFASNTVVECTYAENAGELTGQTPKFHCRAGDEVYKVKYGASNGEVYAEVVATRLFWALGFGADTVYPVRVQCRACPMDPWLWRTSVRFAQRLFEYATIERKFEGQPIASGASKGWSWAELDEVDPAVGGAPAAHRDALKLLAVFVQHGDNKAEQQRMVCLPGGERRTKDGVVCDRPFLVVSDLGATFGGAGRLSRDQKAKLRFAEWSSKPVFKDPARCIGALNASIRGSLGDPPISEAGRRFLAELLARISDRQIRDLFTAARIEGREDMISESGRRRPVTVDDWVGAFKERRRQIEEHRCVDTSVASPKS